MEKSWPYRLTAVDSRAIHRRRRRCGLTTELHVEPAGGLHVERQHQIVDVTPDRCRLFDLLPQRPVVGQPDVVDVVDLDHEVHDPGAVGERREGNRVVARVDAEEAQPRRVVASPRPTTCGGSCVESRSLKPRTSR